jgi:hypothetical protein
VRWGGGGVAHGAGGLALLGKSHEASARVAVSNAMAPYEVAMLSLSPAGRSRWRAATSSICLAVISRFSCLHAEVLSGVLCIKTINLANYYIKKLRWKTYIYKADIKKHSGNARTLKLLKGSRAYCQNRWGQEKEYG